MGAPRKEVTGLEGLAWRHFEGGEKLADLALEAKVSEITLRRKMQVAGLMQRQKSLRFSDDRKILDELVSRYRDGNESVRFIVRDMRSRGIDLTQNIAYQLLDLEGIPRSEALPRVPNLMELYARHLAGEAVAELSEESVVPSWKLQQLFDDLDMATPGGLMNKSMKWREMIAVRNIRELAGRYKSGEANLTDLALEAGVSRKFLWSRMTRSGYVEKGRQPHL